MNTDGKMAVIQITELQHTNSHLGDLIIDNQEKMVLLLRVGVIVYDENYAPLKTHDDNKH